jgi:hypothetical protein
MEVGSAIADQTILEVGQKTENQNTSNTKRNSLFLSAL